MSGAVEQLRTHVVRLANMYSEEQVQLYERGYGKDPAGNNAFAYFLLPYRTSYLAEYSSYPLP